MPIEDLLPRRVKVYLPPDYDQANASYPTLYLLHGRGDHERTWQARGEVEAVTDDLIAQGAVTPLVIVMPYGFISPEDQDVAVPRNNRYATPQEWRQYLVDQLIPDVQRQYRVRREREHRAIAGASMGSEQALDVVFSDLSQFSGLGCFSPAFPRQRFNREAIPERWPQLVGYAEGPRLTLCYVAWASGENDEWIDAQYTPLRDALADRGVNVSGPPHPIPGGHNWNPPNPWRECLRDFLTRLWK